MKVFTCTQFTGFRPVGTSAVIVAATIEEAREMLEAKLAEIGLPQELANDDLVQVSLYKPSVDILQDGDY